MKICVFRNILNLFIYLVESFFLKNGYVKVYIQVVLLKDKKVKQSMGLKENYNKRNS